MKNVLKAIMIVGALAFLAAPAVADWVESDGHKMHWPQLPDPNGWDIDVVAPNIVADDWRCSQTGPVKDVHLWFSMERDGDGNPLAVVDEIQWVRLSIHKDIPANESPTGYSMPGEQMWEYYPQDVQIPQIPHQGDQGWASPAADPPIWRRSDHNYYFQGNVVDIPEPFIQREGEIYWLDVSVGFPDGYQGPRVGWKTTFPTKDQPGGGWNDDAVYWGPNAAGEMGWQELWESGETGGRSLDMAFVITPEPGTLAMLLGLGLIGLLASVLRRKK